MKIFRNPFPVSVAAMVLYLLGTLMVMFGDKSDISIYIQKLLICGLQVVPYVVMLSSNITSLRNKTETPRSTVLATVLASAITNLIISFLMESGSQPYGLYALLDAAEIEFDVFCMTVFWTNFMLLWLIPYINKSVIIIYSSTLSAVYILGIVFQALDGILYREFNDIFSVCFILAAILLHAAIILWACKFNRNNSGDGWECLLGLPENDDLYDGVYDDLYDNCYDDTLNDDDYYDD